MKMLQLMSDQIEQSYNIDLVHLLKMFESIVRDEEHH